MELILDEGIVDTILESLGDQFDSFMRSGKYTEAAELEAIRDIIIEQIPE